MREEDGSWDDRKFEGSARVWRPRRWGGARMYCSIT